MDAAIRTARPDEAGRICAVHRAAILGICSASYTPSEIAAWVSLLTPDKYSGPLRTQVMYVAERDGEIVGFSQLDADRASIEAVYVSPNALGAGIGRALLERLEAEAKQLGLPRLMLDAALNAEAFYAHMGYERVHASQHRIAPGIALACVRMQKILA